MLGFLLIGLLGVALVSSISDDDDSEVAASEAGTSVDGTSGDDFIDAAGGDDSIFALEGSDLVLAGEGDDRAFGSDGEDFLVGEAGNDFLRGGDSDDLLYGSAGEDTLLGDAGDDVLDGTDVIDVVGLVEFVRETAAGGGFPTEEELEAFGDINGDTGEADLLFGGAGNDDIAAGDNDTVDTGGGEDTVTLGDWITGVADNGDVSETPVVDGFNPELDSIVYVFEGDTPPVITWSEEDNGGNMLADGEVVARFTNTSFNGLVNETVELLPF